ncbi:MAG: hypothetical protein HYW02_07425 [Deltaproteobacteria bacterium]|nr:hypothetical protein [Deltaproteobacteria bacterium]
MIKFGTDGWRAIIEEEFTEENVDRVTLAFAKFMKETSRPSGKIYVGFDRRRKSDLMAKRAASLLASQGYQVFLASSFCPTPCVSWNTKADRAIAGMMITASHNPPQWNGIKFKEEDGGAASPEYTTEIEKIIEQNDKNPTIPSTSRGGERDLILTTNTFSRSKNRSISKEYKRRDGRSVMTLFMGRGLIISRRFLKPIWLKFIQRPIPISAGSIRNRSRKISRP